MAEDWFADVRKYADGADPDHVAGIVRYCGIALRKRDSALVSFSSPEEIARVRENFLKKKLALGHPDSALDEAIAAVGERMKADRTKNRVTVYYLLADHFGRLDDFTKAPKSASAKVTESAPAGGSRVVSGKPSAPPELQAEPQPSAPASFQPQPQPAAASAPAPASPMAAQRSEFTSSASGKSAGENYPSSGGPARLAGTSPQTGTRWWLWVVLLVVVVILLWLLFR